MPLIYKDETIVAMSWTTPPPIAVIEDFLLQPNSLNLTFSDQEDNTTPLRAPPTPPVIA